MKASTLYVKVKNAAPDANVFVRCGGKFYSIDEVILSAVDPTIQPPTTVTLDGKELYPEDTVLELIERAAARAIDPLG